MADNLTSPLDKRYVICAKALSYLVNKYYLRGLLNRLRQQRGLIPLRLSHFPFPIRIGGTITDQPRFQ